MVGYTVVHHASAALFSPWNVLRIMWNPISFVVGVSAEFSVYADSKMHCCLGERTSSQAPT
eukprot:9466836-Pyramimonas_sp.AAC.1